MQELSDTKLDVVGLSEASKLGSQAFYLRDKPKVARWNKEWDFLFTKF